MSMIIDGTNGLTFNNATTQASAGLVAGGTIATGTITALSTNGVTFPATQVPSADANTLDDYEEGTWTPRIVGTVTDPTVTYSQRPATYTKIGRMCYFQCIVVLSAYSGGSGRVLVEGLPFTAGASGVGNGAPGQTLVSNITLPALYTQVTNYVDPSTTRFNWLAAGSGQAYSDLTVSAFTNSTSFIVSGFYIVA
jgi:hypothetical protein